MTVQELAVYLDERISVSLSEPWDNDGRMVIPHRETEVTGVLCALDCTSGAIARAKELGCNVILTHHPLIFKPLASLADTDSVGKRVIACVESGIAVLSYHTRLDSLEGGVNDCLAEALGLRNVTSFLPFGRIGEVEEQPFETFASHVGTALETKELSLVKATPAVKKVALVSGSGKDEIREALEAGADTFVTGEANHSSMLDCMELGLNLICATHYATERVVLPFLQTLAEEAGLKAVIYPFAREAEYGI
ncbi:MAG: Nif3-like dinuclear metal center hexameric protein [Clostridia bacterium]|nr:Nif3-like dinuclear metal center hexameric protein [Clostridia bacterium]